MFSLSVIQRRLIHNIFTAAFQWRNFKFRAPLQENHSGPLLPNNIGVSRTFYSWAYELKRRRHRVDIETPTRRRKGMDRDAPPRALSSHLFQGDRESMKQCHTVIPVSYTHLTLPTKRIV